MNKNKGWISLYRSIQDHWLYKEKRKFSKFEAWIDLLLEANHKDNRFPLGNEIVECKRGQLVTSIRQLCDRWRWSNTKVVNFLKLLQDDKMITYFSDTKKTVITIENYNDYQDVNDRETYQKRRNNDAITTRKHTNNNDNNDNNDNKSSSTTEEIEKDNQNDISLIANEFEQNGFGTINFTVKEMIIDLLNEYSTEWIQEAIKIAVKNNKRKLSYVEGILQNWRRNGGMKLGGGSSGENRQDNDEGLGQYKDIGITI